ncbi:MAG TPA: DNA polymerase IV [Bacteroidetes bacterium]|nr:DNA polymerase IV [Bacteroidota bacterium]
MEYGNRSVLHLDLDTFFVSVERLHNRSLEGKPVIIGGLSDRGVVAGCSYEARRFGVHSAMPMKMARLLCSEALFIRGDMERYTRHSEEVTHLIAERAPLYEKASIDEHYIDVSGMDRFFGCLRWSRELRETIIRKTGLPISFGLSVNKTVSKIATGEAKPNGIRNVPGERVQPFLDPLSIRKIPMIGEKTFRLLRSMGISTIAILRQMPPEMMEKVMGKNGTDIWKKANGIDNSPVVAFSERKSLSTERTFERDSIDIPAMERLLVRMVEKLAFEMRIRQRLTSCVTVKIRYANFDTHTLQKRIPYTSFDHILTDVTLALFRQLYRRRIRIRLVGVRFSHLVQGVQQLNMFDDRPEAAGLYLAMDRLRRRYGPDAVRRASGWK